MPQKVNASHILMTKKFLCQEFWSSENQKIFAETETEALAIMHDLRNGKSFEELAREKSLCPSGKKGGSLGWFTRNQMVKEFENACFSGKKGDVVKVKTQFGWHVIKIIDSE